MSNYNKSTNFAVKDTLASGDPDKVVSGAEIDNEFNSIASAVTSKADKVAAATTDNFAALDASGNLKDSGVNAVSVAPPVGSITMYAATTAPSGWLECDGSNVNRVTFPNLFNVIGTTFGAGDGSNTFGLPDLRGEFVRGWDNNRGLDNGRSFASIQGDLVGSHRHEIQAQKSQDDSTGGNKVAAMDAGEDQRNIDTEFSTGEETRPRNIALMYIIKT